MRNNTQRILIIKLNKIGDVLLTTPLFPNLKAYFKECTIDILVNEGTEGLLDSSLLHKIILLKRPKNFFSRLTSNLSLIRTLTKTKYHLVLGLSGGERTAFLAFMAGRKAIRVGFPPKSFWAKNIYHYKIPFLSQHNVESNLEALRTLGIPIHTKQVCANRTKSDKLNTLPKYFIHCHFFSDWLFKWMSLEFCAQIINHIQETYNIPCVCTAAPNQKEIQALETMKPLIKNNCTTFLSNLTLSEVSYLNSKALAFVGVDTSIMHLSAANGIPTFAFFGPTYVSVWGPWDNECNHSTYQERQGIQKMGKHCVYQEKLPCLPCGKSGCNSSFKSDCLLEKLNKEEALKTLDSFLKPILKDNL